jgi:hypothetical protein
MLEIAELLLIFYISNRLFSKVYTMIEELQQSYGNQFEPALIDEIKDVGILMEVADGHDLIKPGQYIKSMPLLSGSIKICAQML